MVRNLFRFFLLPLIGFSLLSCAQINAQDKEDPKLENKTKFALQSELNELNDKISRLKTRKDALEKIDSLIDDYIQNVKGLINPDIEKDIEGMTKNWENLGSQPTTEAKRKMAHEIVDVVRKLLQQYYDLVGSRNSIPPVGSSEDREFVTGLIRNAFSNALDDLTPKLTQSYEKLIKPASTGLDDYDLISVNSEDFKNYLAIVKQFPQDAANKITDELNKAKDNLTSQVQSTQKEIEPLEERAEQLSNEYDKRTQGQTQIDTKLIYVAIPAFCIVTLILFLSPILIQLKYTNNQITGSIFSSGIILELTTVFLLTGSILILGLGEKITGDILGTLLGGISGFVLGRSISSKNSRQEEPPAKNKPKEQNNTEFRRTRAKRKLPS